MKTIETTTNVYEAFDGKQFANYDDCARYEFENIEKFTRKKLPNFNIDFPLDEYGCTFTAFKVNGEDDYNLLMNYLETDHSDIYGVEEYQGNGFYVVVSSDSDWVEVHTLNEIIENWNKTLAYIVKNISEIN